jgi:NAD(P)H-hydrate epimerase
LGAVILICPRAILPIYEHNLPSIIKKPVGNRDDYFFKEKHVTDVLSIIREKEGKVLLGPGLGREPATLNFVKQFISQNKTDTVIDADGLWCLSQLEDWEKPEPSNWILTPHPGELTRLTQEDISDDVRRLKIVQEYAQEHDVTILSKGMPGIVGTPAGKCYLTNYNTRYFARAGTGDVLAGKISACFTLGYTPDHSCARGLLHGEEKLNNFLRHQQGLPEPSDFI